MKRLTVKDLRVPLLLVVLSLVPMLGGIVRLQSFSQSATEESARFLSSPTPILLHIVSVAFYCLLGAFQFPAAVRIRWPRWHRQAGKALAVCGLVSALSGLWMTLVYPIPVPMQGPFLVLVRIAVGVGMTSAILIAWRAILRRDVRGHEAWMIRAYAIGQGAGTQVVIMLPPILMFGEILGLLRDLLMTLAWLINVAIAEWIIRRRDTRTRPRPSRDRAPLGLSFDPDGASAE